jgi:hypothetical protein
MNKSQERKVLAKLKRKADDKAKDGKFWKETTQTIENFISSSIFIRRHK